MVILITGATGFIGRKVARHHLDAGDEVRVLTRGHKPLGALKGAIGAVHDLNAIQRGDLDAFVDGADVLYHCAGELRDPARMEALHVRGTEALLDAAAGRVGRWVQLSSVGVYGPQRGGVVTEETPPAPVGPYEVTKAASDDLVLAAHAAGRVPAVVLRPSIVFGEDMPNDALRAMARMIRKGLFFFIGPPGASANYVHVDGVVDALVRCATAPAADGRVYNLSDWTTMEDFVGAMAGPLGVRPPRLRLPGPLAWAGGRLGDVLPGFPLTSGRVGALTSRARYATDRIERELGYTHPAPLPDAVRAVVAAWNTP